MNHLNHFTLFNNRKSLFPERISIDFFFKVTSQLKLRIVTYLFTIDGFLLEEMLALQAGTGWAVVDIRSSLVHCKAAGLAHQAGAIRGEGCCVCLLARLTNGESFVWARLHIH